MAREHQPVIRASEIGEYVYCARAWWLRRVAGLEPAGRERRAQGAALHARHGRSVALSRALLIGAALLLSAGIITLAAAVLR